MLLTHLMKPEHFIFSDKLIHRLSRHIVLWIAFSIYFFLVNFFPLNEDDLYDMKTYTDALDKMIYIPVSIFSVYTSIYILVPVLLLKGKHLIFFAVFLLLCLFNIACAYLLTIALTLINGQQLHSQAYIFQSLIYGLGMGAAASGFAIIIKLFKIHYQEQQQIERLQQQIINTELQMIKTNFHPHFLSDALANISDLIRNHSTQSPSVILKLSELLSYILYENEGEQIALDHEMLMVEEYLNLEKIFYGNRIVINLKQEGDLGNRLIAPLILLGLVQNCCEQFLISLQQKLNIDIAVISGENQLLFRLNCNGYYENVHGAPYQNPGLKQALRRIQIIYPGQHKLEIHSVNGIFSMTLLLEQESLNRRSIMQPHKTALYEPA